MTLLPEVKSIEIEFQLRMTLEKTRIDPALISLDVKPVVMAVVATSRSLASGRGTSRLPGLDKTAAAKGEQQDISAE